MPPCPPLTEYTAEERRQALAELEAAGIPPMLDRLVDDYHGIRELCRRAP